MAEKCPYKGVPRSAEFLCELPPEFRTLIIDFQSAVEEWNRWHVNPPGSFTDRFSTIFPDEDSRVFAKMRRKETDLVYKELRFRLQEIRKKIDPALERKHAALGRTWRVYVSCCEIGNGRNTLSLW